MGFRWKNKNHMIWRFRILCNVRLEAIGFGRRPKGFLLPSHRQLYDKRMHKFDAMITE